MIVTFSNHRVDETDVVHAASEMRKERADPVPALAMTAKFIRALHYFAGLAEKAFVLPLSFQRFTVKLLQSRLVVERVNMAHAARAKDLNDTAGARREVRQEGGSRICPGFTIKHPGESQATDSPSGVPKKMTAR